jgi:hypothetical protein
MPIIKLTDAFGFTGDVKLPEDAGVVKYIQSLRQIKVSDINLSALTQVPLDKVPLKSASSGLSFEQPVPVGINQIEMTVKAEGGGRLRLFGPKDKQLFDPEVFGEPVKINDDQLYVSIGVTASLAANLSAEARDLGFGFDAGGQVSLSIYKPFTKSGAGDGAFTPFVQAVEETARDFVLLGDIEDLSKMSEGLVATVEGSGHLKFSAEAELLSVVNPLATVDPPGPGELKVVSGGSVKVGATFQLFGEYQIRAQKLDRQRVRLGIYKKRGKEFTLTVTAKGGASASVGGFDLFERVLKAVSRDPEVDEKQLEAAGLNAGQIAAIEDAVKAAIARKLELAASFELSASSSNEAAFDYEIDLAKLGPEGRQAIHKALDGDLTALAGDAPMPTGVTLRRSIFTEIQKKKHTLKLNLLGIYSFISISALTLKGRVMFVPETGELLITDSATATRIAASISNFAADQSKLRKVLAESFLITAAYRCSKTVAQSPTLEITHSYFESHSDTKPQTMKDSLDAVEALGLMTKQEKDKMVAGSTAFGNTTLYLLTRYDDALATALFLNADGTPRREEEFEQAGRDALKSLIQTGDENDYRRLLATDNAFWNELKHTGNMNEFGKMEKVKGIKAEKKIPIAFIVQTLASDRALIRWWATEMRGMAERLAEIRKFLKDNPTVGPDNNTFNGLRRKLAEHLKGVAERTKEQFGEPWGLVATDFATGRAAKAEAQVTGPRVAFKRVRGE